MSATNIFWILLSIVICVVVLVFLHKSEEFAPRNIQHKNRYLVLRVLVLAMIAIIFALGMFSHFKFQSQKNIENSRYTGQVLVEQYKCDLVDTEVTRTGESTVCADWSGKLMSTDDYLHWESENYFNYYAFGLPIAVVFFGAILDGLLVPKKNS